MPSASVARASARHGSRLWQRRQSATASRSLKSSPAKNSDVRDRLGDRFRLLAGARRGLERHQTLRQAIQWSFDLLDAAERRLLCRCSVFAGGFDAAAAAAVCGPGLDEYDMLDLLDSLVRKSLVTVERHTGPAGYGLLETIRQFAAEELAATGTSDEVRDRHAAYFAGQVVAQLDASYGPGFRSALDWVDTELANPRGWLPMGRRSGRSRHGGGDRRAHHDAGLRPSTLRARGAGSRRSSTPPLRPKARARGAVRADRDRVGGSRRL
jgi:predicted ATPase